MLNVLIITEILLAIYILLFMLKIDFIMKRRIDAKKLRFLKQEEHAREQIQLSEGQSGVLMK